MALFEINKTNTNNVTEKKNKEEGISFEGQLRELKAEKIRVFRQIGEIFYEQNSAEKLTGTEYEALFERLEEIMNTTELVEKQELASRGLRRCNSCGKELPIDSVFCNKCGAEQGKLESEVIAVGKICPKCGASLEAGDKFCLMCGYKI